LNLESKKIDRVFIDANVIANWVIVSEALKQKEENTGKKLLKDLHKKIQNSYFLLEKVKESDGKTCIFYTSQFALCEVYNVIGTEYKSRKLFEKRVPFRYWGIMLKEIKLKDKHFVEIEKNINKMM
jgi:hypothetical protein